MVGVKFLRSHSLFGGISDEGIEVIKPLLKEEYFPKGEFIVKESVRILKIVQILQLKHSHPVQNLHVSIGTSLNFINSKIDPAFR